MRIMHEASLYPENTFVTLTYNEENLPRDGTLSVPKYEIRKNKKGEEVKVQVESSDFQKFMKRLRKRFICPKHKKETRIRFFHCGEYGSNTKRPHYHAILFNMDFPDKEVWQINDLKQPVYRSEILEKLWPQGFSTIGAVTFESAAYVARYVTKKITGEEALEAYNSIDHETGEILKELEPEYCTMSRRPGIARDWYDQFKGDCYPKDFVTVNGKKMNPPKFYDKLYEIDEPMEMQLIKNKREQLRKKFASNNTPERLEAREKVKTAQNKMLVRKAENAQTTDDNDLR